MTATGLSRITTSFVNEHLSIWLNWPNGWGELGVLICMMHLTTSSSLVTYAFHCGSTLYIFLNVKGFLARNRRDIWSLNDCNRTRTCNHLVYKETLNHLTQLTEWLTWILSTCLYRVFDCFFLSFHVHVSEWIHTQYLSECQETRCWNQARCLMFKWLQGDTNPQPLSS